MISIERAKQLGRVFAFLALLLAMVYVGFVMTVDVAAGEQMQSLTVREILLLENGPGILLEKTRALVQGNGLWGNFIFILLYAVTVLLPIPGPLMTWIGAILFGFWQGVLLNVLGANLGVTTTFFLARLIGRDAIRHRIPPDLLLWDKRIEAAGFRTVLFVRMVPFFPFNVINYFFGLSAIRYRDYALGSFLGMLPFTLIVSWVGAASGDFKIDRVISWLPLLVLLCFILIANVAKKRIMNKEAD